MVPFHFNFLSAACQWDFVAFLERRAKEKPPLGAAGKYGFIPRVCEEYPRERGKGHRAA